MDNTYTGNLTRGQKLWNMLRDRRDTEPLSLERAKLVTEAYKKFSILPVILRRGETLKHVLNNIPIYIDEGQLLAGDYGSRPMAAEWFPDFSVEWVAKEVSSGHSPYALGEDSAEEMRQICEFWKDKAAKETFYAYMGDETIHRLYEMNEHGSWIFAGSMEAQTEKGWHIPNYAKVVRCGLRGVIDEIEEEQASLRVRDNESLNKDYFLRALKTSVNAVIDYAHRYAELASHMAEETEDPVRAAELRQIAENCSHVPEFPARTFHEAMQAMWFCHCAAFWDTRTVGISFGRVDQYMLPLYQEDKKAGRVDREMATQIVECFRIKMSALRNFDNSYVRQATSGETQFHNVTLGGVDAYGRDAVNELSYVWLDAAERVQSPHPTLSIRWHDNIDPKFALRGMEICRLGVGYPAWFNDRSVMEFLLSNGATLQEARDYGIAGCVLTVPQNKCAVTWPTVVSMAKVLEITLNNGVDPVNGIQQGLQLGSLPDFETFDDLFDAFKSQLHYFLTITSDYLCHVRCHRSEQCPDLFLSSLVEGCIRKGKNVMADGAEYQQFSMYLIPVGPIDACDSLTAIKKCVYEDKSIGKQELLDLLKANFEGSPEKRRLLLDAPKYGNDDDYADEIAVMFHSYLVEEMKSIEGPYGTTFLSAPHSIAFHGAAGRKCGALPSGRLAGVALADGAVSPAQGSDVKGPAAVIQSASKIDHSPIYGTLFNMKFLPSALEREEDLKKLLALIRTYFVSGNGRHIQFNVVDRAKLIDAQQHPENYRNLVVRIAGYSALWVELDEKIQNEIIARTEQAF